MGHALKKKTRVGHCNWYILSLRTLGPGELGKVVLGWFMRNLERSIKEVKFTFQTLEISISVIIWSEGPPWGHPSAQPKHYGITDAVH